MIFNKILWKIIFLIISVIVSYHLVLSWSFALIRQSCSCLIKSLNTQFLYLSWFFFGGGISKNIYFLFTSYILWTLNGAMTPSLMMLSITALSIIKCSSTTPSIMTHSIHNRHYDTLHNNTQHYSTQHYDTQHNEN